MSTKDIEKMKEFLENKKVKTSTNKYGKAENKIGSGKVERTNTQFGNKTTRTKKISQ